MQPVTITLNEKVVSGHGGMTILEIARESGIDIPTLCHDPHLKPAGTCRLCLVENQENGKLLASCVTEVSPGMVINTESPRVLEHRRNIVKMMLASHPDSCLICDKGNRCRLHHIASDLGIGLNEMERIPRYAAVEELNPFLGRDDSKCVLCGKCIRACREIVVEGALDYYRRGFNAKPATFNDVPLEQSECTFCGTCVAICPTGALEEKNRPYRGTTGVSVQTTCSFCGCGCPLTLEVKDNRIIRSLPAPDSPLNRGALCVRGSFGFDYVHSRDRLTVPLVKENGEFRETSWEEALQVAARGLKKAQNEHGPESLAVYGSPRCTNEENYLLQRFARTVLGTPHTDNSSNFYNYAVKAGMEFSTGFSSATGLLENLEQAEVIIVAGADLLSTAPQVGYAVKRAVRYGDAKLIYLDSRPGKVAFFAHRWLRPRPGSEASLLHALACAMVEEGLHSREYVSRQTEGFSALAGELKNFSPEQVGPAEGVAPEEIRKTARLYAGAAQAVIVFDAGPTGAMNDPGAVGALVNLALLRGNVWGSGSGLYPLRKESNAQGACEMGTDPGLLPGLCRVEDRESRHKFEHLWGVSLPNSDGMSAFEAFRRGKEIPWKALYLVGENPVAALPRPELTGEALSSLDFLVVQELFFTETARLADVVLPAASFAEKEGSFTNFEGRIGWLNQAVDPPGECRPDWKIVLDLALELGTPLPYSLLSQVMNEIEEFVPLYEGYYQSEDRLGEKLSCWEERCSRIFQSFSGFPRFSLPSRESEPPAPGEKVAGAGNSGNNGNSVTRGNHGDGVAEHPFYLMLEDSPAYFGSGVRSGKALRLKELYPPESLKMEPGDAAKLSLKPGEKVTITSLHGELTARVDILENLAPGTVMLPVSHPEIMKLFAAPGISKAGNSMPHAVRETAVRVKVERVDFHG